MTTGPFSWTKLQRQPAVIGLLIALGVFAALAGLRVGGVLQSLELAVYDAYLRWRPEHPRPDSHLTLIAITDRDITALGHWPMTDDTLADIVDALLTQRPRVVGFDLYRDLAVPPGTERLNSLLRATTRIVMVEKFGSGNEPSVPPPEAVAGTERVGFADLMVDPGGAVRRALLFLDDGTRVAYSLPLRLALLYLHDQGIDPQAGTPDPAAMRLGPTTIMPFAKNDGGYVAADDRGYQMLLDFAGGLTPFNTYTLGDLLGGKIPSSMLRDKLVLVGVAADSVKDLFLTPYSQDQSKVASIPGMYLHAHAGRQLLRMALDGVEQMRVLDETLEYGWILLWIAIGAALSLFVRSLSRLLFFTGLASLGLGGITYGALLAGWWLPAVPAALGVLGASILVIAYLSVLERTERRFLMEIFSKHVSGDVAEEIWRQRDDLMSDGRIETQELTVTVLFSDLENFTPIAEQLSPREMMNWLNDYMEAMAGLVFAYGGVVDDYYGDAIKANFGAPLARTTYDAIADDARRAVACALAMADAMDGINARYTAQGLPPARMRIGLSTGLVVAGCLGSAQRMKYTTIGDVVNTAARLQAYGKEIPATAGPCTTVIAADTQQLLDERFVTEFVGTPSLKGKIQSVAAYRVLSCSGTLAAARPAARRCRCRFTGPVARPVAVCIRSRRSAYRVVGRA